MTAMMNETKENTHVCPHKYSFMLDNWLRRLIQKPSKIVGEYINPGDTVIDLGCGPGFFTVDMAKYVGPTGKVIAVDLQPEMLSHLERKASKKNMDNRITYHQCGSRDIGLKIQADFILAFYMIHEVPDPRYCLMQIKEMMKNGAKLLVVEPKFHVSDALLKEMIKQAEDVGLVALEYPKKKGGKSVLFGKRAG